MTKAELKRKLMIQRMEAVLGIDRKEIELNTINYDFPMEYSELMKLERRSLLELRTRISHDEEIFTTELLKQENVKLH